MGEMTISSICWANGSFLRASDSSVHWSLNPRGSESDGSGIE